MTGRARSLVLGAAVLGWTAAVGVGLRQVWSYSTTPGAVDVHPARWPAESAIGRAAGRSTLVMFVHPLCPCSRASLSELAEIQRSTEAPLTTFVVFLRPSGTDDGWEKSWTWDAAERIPGVRVMTDVAGAEAARFGAATSGQVLLYDEDANLTFAGGITGSRGHAGDNPGRRRVLALIHQRTPDRDSSHVYGCPMADPETGHL